MALIIDVETIGLPQRDGLPYGQNPSYEKLNMYDSARIVQVSMMLCNEHFEQVELNDFIIKANDFTIGKSKFHCITNKISTTKGIPFAEVAEVLSTYLKQVTHIVAHNANFDISIINSELYRLGMYSLIAELKTKQILCTMNHTKLIVNAQNNYGVKDPSLEELYYYVFKQNITNHHNSKDDVINLHSIVKRMYDTKQLNYNENMVYSSEKTLVKSLKNDNH